MSVKHLKNSGLLYEPEAQAPNDTNDALLKKPALLVHAGSFQSQDGPIQFDGPRLERVVSNHNAMINKLAKDYGGIDKMPLGAFPAILNSHDDDDTDKVIGRLSTTLEYAVRDIPGVGKNVPCIVAKEITFLGKHTCEKVRDGRIYHLSVGIDEDTDTLGEVSAVTVPAAPGAMLLSKGKEKPNAKKLLKGAKEMSLKKLKALHAEAKATLVKAKESGERTRLAAAKANVHAKLTHLMRGGKMSPAEFKKVDLTKLAAMDAKSLSTAMEIYEGREAVIQPGQRGTTAAVDFTKLADGAKTKHLRAEIAKDFGLGGVKLTRLSSGFGSESTKEMSEGEEKELSFGEAAEKKLATIPTEDEKKLAADDEEEKKKLSGHMADLKKHLESGNIEEAKKCMAAVEECGTKGMKHMSLGVDMDDQSSKTMAEMQEQIDMLQTNLAKVAEQIEQIMSAEQAEADALAGEQTDQTDQTELAAPGEKPVEPGTEAPEDKKLGADEKPEEKKLGEVEKPEEKKLGADEKDESKKLEAGEAGAEKKLSDDPAANKNKALGEEKEKNPFSKSEQKK